MLTHTHLKRLIKEAVKRALNENLISEYNSYYDDEDDNEDEEVYDEYGEYCEDGCYPVNSNSDDYMYFPKEGYVMDGSTNEYNIGVDCYNITVIEGRETCIFYSTNEGNAYVSYGYRNMTNEEVCDIFMKSFKNEYVKYIKTNVKDYTKDDFKEFFKNLKPVSIYPSIYSGTEVDMNLSVSSKIRGKIVKNYLKKRFKVTEFENIMEDNDDDF